MHTNVLIVAISCVLVTYFTCFLCRLFSGTADLIWPLTEHPNCSPSQFRYSLYSTHYLPNYIPSCRHDTIFLWWWTRIISKDCHFWKYLLLTIIFVIVFLYLFIHISVNYMYIYIYIYAYTRIYMNIYQWRKIIYVLGIWCFTGQKKEFSCNK